MTDRVYQGGNIKFFTYTGKNAYAMKDGNNVTLPAASPSPNLQSIVMSDEAAVQTSGLITIDPTDVTGRITFNESGIYSVSVILNFENPASLAAANLVQSFLLYSTDNALDLYKIDEYISTLPISVTSNTVSAQMKFVGYLEKGEGLLIKAGNVTTTTSVTVLAATSALLVSRIY